MLALFAVGLGGFFGAIARYGLASLVHRLTGSALPVGTLAVNVLGCLVIGALLGLVEDRQMLSSTTRLFLMIGLLGSFTTFSTFGYETYELLVSGEFVLAVGNLLANTLLGVTAVAVGRATVALVGL